MRGRERRAAIKMVGLLGYERARGKGGRRRRRKRRRGGKGG